jgi:aspartyl-tRNA(Asn)/glutamyl-tRNA(Gln) amidotransferase subunit A
VLTAAKGGFLHRNRLRTEAMRYDPATRSRLIAGSLLPPQMIADAGQVAELFKQEVSRILEQFDILVAPATPCSAPMINEGTILLNGTASLARANLGLHAQPISLAGVPVLTVPLARHNRLPMGIQLIAAKGREACLFAAARKLESAGVIACDWPTPMPMTLC